MLSPGQRLRMMRESCRQSLRDVEQAVGLHYSYIGALEREHKSFGRLRAEHVLALARHFGVSADYLLGRAPPDTGRFLRAKMARLRSADLDGFRRLNHPGLRLRRVLEWLAEEGYPEFAPERLGMLLGVRPAEWESVLSGRADLPDALLERVLQETGIPGRLIISGELGPGDDLLHDILQYPEAEAYLEVVALALREKVPARSLLCLVRSLIAARG